jgi:hypothetical protein
MSSTTISRKEVEKMKKLELLYKIDCEKKIFQHYQQMKEIKEKEAQLDQNYAEFYKQHMDASEEYLKKLNALLNQLNADPVLTSYITNDDDDAQE